MLPGNDYRKVAAKAIKTLFQAPSTQRSEQTVVIPGSEQSPIINLYHLRENASGSIATIPGVNSRNGELEKEIGITAISGITRKNRTRVQIAR